jgi:small-conductance mechanosensitive channel
LRFAVEEGRAKWAAEKKIEQEKQQKIELERERKEQLKHDIIAGILLFLTTSLVIIILWLFRKYMPIIYSRIKSLEKSSKLELNIQKVKVLSSETSAGALFLAVRALRIVITVIVLYFYLSLILWLFHGTRGIVISTTKSIISILGSIGSSFVSYIPKLLFIIFVLVIARYAVRFIKFLFNEIKRESIVIPNFHKDWIKPTQNIILFLIIIITLTIIFPYLPGYDSPAFKGISVFVGVLISLGSTSVVGNIMAGLFLTYSLSFRVGDRVKIGDAVGDIIEKTLLVTRLKTIKNEMISIPNSLVLSQAVINYSHIMYNKDFNNLNLILHTSVTIGYDVEWRQVHKLLIEAAKSTEGILHEPEPFVLQTSLDDYYVNYQINAYTDDPSIMIRTYSLLHQNIQDKFNEERVEILSPAYRSIRDGNEITIPAQYRDKDYSPSSFRVTSKKEE